MPLLSICMVSLNCRRVIEDCLVSLRTSTFQDFEIVCADNGSTDGTIAYLRAQSDVRLIENGYNAGFTKGTNQAIAASSGAYVLWLNTDTVLREDSLGAMLEFLKTHPRAGVVGPKVLNADGSFQAQCKRGIPTPLASLCYVLGLDRVWPRHRVAGRYLLRYVSEDESSVVDAVSGCCLMTRRDVVEQVGPLDEEMFGFGEDLDWCVRAAKAGWEVWYHPGSVITHLKGMGGAHSKPYRKIRGMHGCMWLFYKKHLKRPLPVTMLVAAGIGASFALQMTATWLRRSLRLSTPSRN
jgi:GT2 family glycosyltransferase